MKVFGIIDKIPHFRPSKKENSGQNAPKFPFLELLLIYIMYATIRDVRRCGADK